MFCESLSLLRLIVGRDTHEILQVAFLMYTFSFSKASLLTPCSIRVVDTVNVAFIMHANYVLGVTDFGDYRTNLYRPW